MIPRPLEVCISSLTDTIAYVLKDNHYSPSVMETPEFQTNLDVNTPCNRFVTSLFNRERLLYILKYGIIYVDGQTPEKHIMRYPQFFASKAIIKRLESGGKSGIIFHTQGSGKTELAGLSVRILRDYYANKGITARFYYVVDRLDLLTQVSGVMSSIGLSVTNVNSRDEFEKELNKVLSTNVAQNSDGEITVVNVQKFEDKIPKANNDYQAKIQRVFFVDEAHRSYKLRGTYFTNLMLADSNAVYIAMTGTPLLSKKERSSLKFGDYIHKYFYDKSIADGYTLRIKKEDIETKARTEIKKNLELAGIQADKKLIMESPSYINSLCQFIKQDFENFRLVNTDNTIGGMIVCCSNGQARKIKEWFDKQDSLETGLVITDPDIPSAVNTNTQNSFKFTLKPDLLIVNQMLTTGYDVRRLKKMYLLRNAKEHTLLQTISRVNRPYKSPTGKVYEYGYIVDFVDIAEEYDRTIEMYLKEMADDFSEDEEEKADFAGLVIGPDDIQKKYLKYKEDLASFVE
ncbi:MAG: type I restriction endonuclease subunit R, partial [Clostridia bacterium]|nr:type I restriction endonuclease subunit R [Clostridia bacterium]